MRSGLYRKEYLPLKITRNDKEAVRDALIYIMNRGYYAAPNEFYYDTIRIGYGNFGLPKSALEEARRMAEKDQKRFRAEARAGKVGIPA